MEIYTFWRAPRRKHPIYLCTEPEFIELGEAAIAVFPYPRKAEMAGNEHSLGETFARQLDEFNRRFEQRPGCYKLFFGHFGVAGARVSSGQPLVGRCAEYPLDPLRSLKAQYVGLSHVHLRQQLAPRIWYCRVTLPLRLQRSRRQRLPPGDAECSRALPGPVGPDR